MEVVATGFREPVGVAVDDAGDIYLSDRKAGTVTSVDPAGRSRIVVRGLKKPAGLTLDPEGRLLIAEPGRGRVLRRESSGALTVVAAGIKKPRWVATAPDGMIYVAASAIRRDGGDDEDAPDRHGHHADDVIVRVTSDGTVSVFADGFKGLAGIALHAGALYAATERLRGEREGAGSTVVRIGIGPDGQPDAREILVRLHAERPMGLAVDRLGAVFFTVNRPHADGDDRDRRGDGEAAKGLIMKWSPDGRLATVAARLPKPRGLAMETEGHLLTTDGGDENGHHGRLLRFRAPAAPEVEAPTFTNRSPVTMLGAAEIGAHVAAYRADDLTTALATGSAAAPARQFSLSVPLVPNGENRLAVFATGAGGFGLASAPAPVTVVHDDRPPTVRILEPLPGAFIRQAATLTAGAADDGSGVALVALTLDGRALATLVNPDPAQAFAASTRVDSVTMADGAHTLAVTAHDRAENAATASQAFIVDNTPPDTEVIGGPSGEIGDTNATFTVTGTDTLCPAATLQFAWRLDGGPWSPFAAATTITLGDLKEGAHTFEVKARDLAGNEDGSPARRTFTVSLLRVTIIEPAARATVAAGLVLVRGTVEAGAAEVGVTVNDVSAAVQGTAFAVLVPAAAGTMSLTAVAKTAKGATATHQVPIAVVSAPPPAVALHPSPASGVAPLPVSFSLVGATPVVALELDADGDGAADFHGGSLDGQIFTYDRPGLYAATVTAIDGQGHRHTARALVEVVDRGVLDRLLRAKWVAMKDALRAGDVSGALESIALGTRDDYHDLLTALTPSPQIDLILTDISPVSFDGDRAEYQMIRMDGVAQLSYLVLFVRDADGLWRVKFF